MEEYETILKKGNKYNSQLTAKRIIVPLVILLAILLGLCLVVFTCIAVTALIIGITLGSLFPVEDRLLYWDWNTINTTDVNFPKGFWFGTASAAHQVEGNCNNNQWFVDFLGLCKFSHFFFLKKRMYFSILFLLPIEMVTKVASHATIIICTNQIFN